MNVCACAKVVVQVLSAEKHFIGQSRSWVEVISGYAASGQTLEVLRTYRQMLEAGLHPNKIIFLCVLKACSSLGDLEEGKRVHDEIMQHGYGSDVCIGNSLLNMYANSGSITDAKFVFESMVKRSVVSWNAMISAYCRHEQAEHAFQLYTDMLKLADISPNDRTFVGVLQSCCSLAAKEDNTLMQGKPLKVDFLQKGKEIHVEVLRRGLLHDIFVSTSLINVFACCGSTMDAQIVFVSMPAHSLVSWNTIIGAYADGNDCGKSIDFYVRMHDEGFKPNDRTFVSLLKAFCNVSAGEPNTHIGEHAVKVNTIVMGKAIHSNIVQNHHWPDPFVGSALINMYACCGSIQDARDVFDSLSLPLLDEVVWNTMIAGYCQREQAENALQLYMQMEAKGVRPSETTFLSILRACSQLGALNTCTDVHVAITKNGLDKCTNVAHALIHAYGKCGSMIDALEVFQGLLEHDIVSWNTLLAGYARQGEWEILVHYFDKMVETGIMPDEVTFVTLLAACSHAGKIDKGLEYFDLMSTAYGISASSEHYSSMVDLLGRAGKFRLAEDFIVDMPMQPTSSLWLSLLGSCRKHGEVHLGRRVFDQLHKADAKLSAPYVMMAQIYAQAGMWEDASKIVQLKCQSGAAKAPGQSWIEQDSGMHMFSARI